MAPSLEHERLYYAAHEAAWLTTYQDRYVVVKGDRLVGAFDTSEDALTAGAASCGLDAFLVRTLGEKPEEVNIPALTLGILRANPQYPIHGPGC